MILISLIGEQPIPNLLPLWQYEKFDQVQFAVTETTRAVGDSLSATITHDPQLKKITLLKPLMLHAYDIQKSRLSLSRAINQHLENGEEVCVNLTGGTKIMSLAALQAVYATGVSLLYVSTEEQQIIYFSSDGVETGRDNFDVHITVTQYLQACGLEVSDNYGFKDKYHADLPPKSGDALEKKVESIVRESGLFDDVRRGVFIRKRTNIGEVKNELDVVAIRNTRLVVCSCKATREVTNDDLYELSTLSRREAAGIYCGKVFATTAPVTDALVERARLAGINLVSGSQIEQIDYYFKQATE